MSFLNFAIHIEPEAIKFLITNQQPSLSSLVDAARQYAPYVLPGNSRSRARLIDCLLQFSAFSFANSVTNELSDTNNKYNKVFIRLTTGLTHPDVQHHKSISILEYNVCHFDITIGDPLTYPNYFMNLLCDTNLRIGCFTALQVNQLRSFYRRYCNDSFSYSYSWDRKRKYVTSDKRATCEVMVNLRQYYTEVGISVCENGNVYYLPMSRFMPDEWGDHFIVHKCKLLNNDVFEISMRSKRTPLSSDLRMCNEMIQKYSVRIQHPDGGNMVRKQSMSPTKL